MRDEPRTDALERMKALAARGIATVMLTGDDARTAAAIGRMLGVTPRADLMPDDRLAIVNDLKRQGQAVAKMGPEIHLAGGSQYPMTTAPREMPSRKERIFREATAADAVNLAALSIQVWLHTYAKSAVRTALSSYVLAEFTERNFAEALDATHQLFVVCEEGSHLVGYVRLDFEAPCPSAP